MTCHPDLIIEGYEGNLEGFVSKPGKSNQSSGKVGRKVEWKKCEGKFDL